MPNYDFNKSDDEQMANRMFNIRAVFVVCAFLGMLGPILLLVGGLTVAGWDGDTWVSVPNVDLEQFSELKNPFVCQIPTLLSTCPDGQVASSNGNYCFKYFEEHQTYLDAAATCLSESLLASFACIHNEEDNAAVHKFCKEDAPCWIGALRDVGTNIWYWTDGTLMTTFQKWSDGHPLPMESNSDLGAYGVMGYKRWAGAAVVLGALAVAAFSIQILILLAMCYVMNNALKDKDSSCMCIIAGCDGGQALLLFLVFLFACIAATNAKGAAVVGAAVSISFTLIAFVLVAYLVYAGCRMKTAIEEQIKATATE